MLLDHRYSRVKQAGDPSFLHVQPKAIRTNQTAIFLQEEQNYPGAEAIESRQAPIDDTGSVEFLPRQFTIGSAYPFNRIAGTG